jgi:hypothetical protein
LVLIAEQQLAMMVVVVVEEAEVLVIEIDLKNQVAKRKQKR